MGKNNEDEYTYDEQMAMPFARVSDVSSAQDRRSYHPKNIWELDITEFVDAVDPKDYFVTSGEATIKARRLEKDLFAMAGKARRLSNLLKKLKGENVYLETTWQDGRLLLKAKNPRKNKDEKRKALEENFVYGNKDD